MNDLRLFYLDQIKIHFAHPLFQKHFVLLPRQARGHDPLPVLLFAAVAVGGGGRGLATDKSGLV